MVLYLTLNLMEFGTLGLLCLKSRVDEVFTVVFNSSLFQCANEISFQKSQNKLY